MGFYVELHCDTVKCPHGCAEEGPQGTHKAKIAAEARRLGWRKIGGRWFCKSCVADRNWDPELEDEVIEARAALGEYE